MSPAIKPSIEWNAKSENHPLAMPHPFFIQCKTPAERYAGSLKLKNIMTKY